MDAKEFLANATNPGEWLTKSVDLRIAGDRLWDRFFKCVVQWGKAQASERDVDLLEKSEREGGACLWAAKLLYGLALETAFKAHILENQPEKIELTMSADGTAQIQHVELKQFGVSLGSGHNLLKLGETAELFSDGVDIHEKGERKAVREVLKHLSEVVYWSGKYPIPKKSGQSHEAPEDIPMKFFGHYLRDWTDPILDYYQGEY